MTQDIHIWLTDEEAAKIRELAEAEERSLTAMARVLLRAALKRRKVKEPADG